MRSPLGAGVERLGVVVEEQLVALGQRDPAVGVGDPLVDGFVARRRRVRVPLGRDPRGAQDRSGPLDVLLSSDGPGSPGTCRADGVPADPGRRRGRRLSGRVRDRRDHTLGRPGHPEPVFQVGALLREPSRESVGEDLDLAPEVAPVRAVALLPVRVVVPGRDELAPGLQIPEMGLDGLQPEHRVVDLGVGQRAQVVLAAGQLLPQVVRVPVEDLVGRRRVHQLGQTPVVLALLLTGDVAGVLALPERPVVVDPGDRARLRDRRRCCRRGGRPAR